jgi:AraC-like DNA-binding protein
VPNDLRQPLARDLRVTSFAIQPAWRVLLRDLGISEVEVLRRASLPLDLFSREAPELEAPAYFRLWEALAQEAGDAALPIRIGEALTVEGFDALLLAVLSSADLDTALDRLRRFKRLTGPMAMTLERDCSTTHVYIACLAEEPMPPVLLGFELVFVVQLARLATRVRIRPESVTAPRALPAASEYAAYFGVPVERGSELAVTFATSDAKRPFVTRNPAMWRFFEPELQRQLRALDDAATMAEQVRVALLELLPSGRASIEQVASAMHVSPRTLQRRLRVEGTRFQAVLSRTREELALHYLERSDMSGAEISFLLGYEDPNSFFRAFAHWTGKTPETARAALRSAR